MDLNLKYVFNKLALVKINNNNVINGKIATQQNITSTIPTTQAQKDPVIFIRDEENPFKESNSPSETFYNYLQGKRFVDN